MASYALKLAKTDNAFGGTRYLHIRADVVELAPDGSPRNLSPDDRYSDHRGMAGITITAQADDDAERTAINPAYSYGWRFGLSSHEAVPTDNLAVVLATLRKAERSMARAESRFGPAETFGAYVARIADALALPVLTGHAGKGGFYSDPDAYWYTMTPGESVRFVDGWIADFRKV